MIRAGLFATAVLLSGWPVQAQDGGQAVPIESAAHAQAHVAAGLTKLRQGDAEAAVAELRAAFQGKPSNAAIATDLGFALASWARRAKRKVTCAKPSSSIPSVSTPTPIWPSCSPNRPSASSAPTRSRPCYVADGQRC